MHSNPMLKHSDTDGYSDYQEQKKMARNPLIHEYARDSVEFLLEDTEFLHAGYAETYNWDGDESIWTFVQGVLSGVFNVTELYRDMLTEYLATYSENVDKPNEELRKIMVGWLDELYALGIASANELGDQHKIGGYINDINNLRNIINGGSYSVTAVYTDCEKLVAFANQHFPKKTVLKIRTPEMGNIAWKAAFSELDSFDPKGIGKTVAFDALSGGVDIATTLDTFTKVHANMNAFERSAIFLDKLSNSYNNQMSKAAQDVLSEMGGAFGKEMKKAIVSDAVEMSINIALSIAACNPYVAAVLFAKSLFVGILKVEDTVKNKHAMVVYYEMAYGYTLCVYESGWAVTKRYYHDKNGQLGYYLANMAQVRILGERKYALYEPDEKDQADSNITDVVNAVRNLEVTFSPSFH
jgi:hypothetical protein